MIEVELDVGEVVVYADCDGEKVESLRVYAFVMETLIEITDKMSDDILGSLENEILMAHTLEEEDVMLHIKEKDL